VIVKEKCRCSLDFKSQFLKPIKSKNNFPG
jgi:hypothetical protein